MFVCVTITKASQIYVFCRKRTVRRQSRTRLDSLALYNGLVDVGNTIDDDVNISSQANSDTKCVSVPGCGLRVTISRVGRAVERASCCDALREYQRWREEGAGGGEGSLVGSALDTGIVQREVSWGGLCCLLVEEAFSNY